MTTANQPLMRTYLRDMSMTKHLQTEAAFLPTGQFPSQSAYFTFLHALFECHCKLGRPAATARRDQSEIDEEDKRISALAADLRINGPAPQDAAVSMGTDYAWGVGYVLNGSALGAAILLKHPGTLGKDWPRRYLQLGRDYASSGRLRQFFDRLNCEPRHRQQVEHGALDTFSMISAMSPKGPVHECPVI